MASFVLSLLSIFLPLLAFVVLIVVLLFFMARLAAKRRVWFTRRPQP